MQFKDIVRTMTSMLREWEERENGDVLGFTETQS